MHATNVFTQGLKDEMHVSSTALNTWQGVVSKALPRFDKKYIELYQSTATARRL